MKNCVSIIATTLRRRRRSFASSWGSRKWQTTKGISWTAISSRSSAERQRWI